MRYFFAFLALGIVWFLGIGNYVSAAFPNQGFTSYNETSNGNIIFSCAKQCVIVLDEDSTILTLSGIITGKGNIGYGFLINDTTLYPGASTTVNELQNEYTWKLIDSPVYKQFRKANPKIVLLIEGNVTTNGLVIDQRDQSFGEKMTQFFTVERLAPYSINLRYGPYRGSTSWPLLGLMMFLIVIIIWPLVSGKKYTLHSFSTMMMGVAVSIMVIGGIRVLIDNIKITYQNKSMFTESNNMRFNDLDDYIFVAKKVRDTLDLDNINARKNKKCLINANAHQLWPYVTHWNFVYLRPCETTQTGSEADYILYYKVPPVVLPNQQVLSSGDTFTLLQNNK